MNILQINASARSNGANSTRLADSIAQLPVKLYRRGKGGEKESLSSDPLASILVHAPNGWMTSFEFRELMMSWSENIAFGSIDTLTVKVANFRELRKIII